MASTSTSPSVADATAKLSEVLSTERGRRTLHDASGFLRREPSTKTILSTTNARSYPSSNSFIQASYDSLSVTDSDGGELSDLAVSMKLVHSYAARVKQIPPSPKPNHFSSEWAPSGSNVLFKAAAVLVIAKHGLPARPSSYESRAAPRLALPPLRRASTGFQKFVDIGKKKMLEDPVKTVKTRNAAPTPSRRASVPTPSRHATVPSRKRVSTPDIRSNISTSSNSIYARPSGPSCSSSSPQRRTLESRRPRPQCDLNLDARPSPSSSRRFHVRGIAHPSEQLTEVFY